MIAARFIGTAVGGQTMPGSGRLSSSVDRLPIPTTPE